MLQRFIAILGTLGKRLRQAVPRWRTGGLRLTGSRRLPASVRHLFPESNNRFMQLVLLGHGLLPLLTGALHARVWARRKRIRRLLGKLLYMGEQAKLHPAHFLCGATVTAAICLVCTFYTIGTTVTYDGQVLGTVADEAQVVEAIASVEALTTDALGKSFTMDAQLIHFDSGIVPRNTVAKELPLAEDLTQRLNLVDYGYTLFVDGEKIGTTPYEGALDDLLEQMVDIYVDENTVSIGFAEQVDIAEEYVAKEEMVNLGFIAEKLMSTKTGEVNYTVVKGDTWSQIAQRNSLTSKELLALNPGYDVDSLSIGEVLTISNAVPYLTITEVERQSYEEEVAYDVVYQDDSTMYEGNRKVLSKGVYGLADVEANVTYVNGVETAREVITSVITKEPVTELQARGTKPRPSWYPTGSFQWPTNGRITSYFGYRNLRWASSNHKGIDIANARGTAIYAADGGIVTYSGWMGSYGYLIKIDHQNGFETYYAHNSKNVVYVGQKVYKGQKIANMGTTGNTSGSHLHFEVRYKGVAKNPLGYLS